VATNNELDGKDLHSGTNLLLSYYNHAISVMAKQTTIVLRPEQIAIIETLLQEVIALINATL
jgi:hypothetical protein